MNTNFVDQQYLSIVDHILKDKEFKKIADYDHHGTDRLCHSMKVSYYSYKIARKMGLDFEATAKAGLLHDFFLAESKDSFTLLFKHSHMAVNNSINQFGISEKEKNIIETHMFPLNLKPSKYTEGWLVNLVDKSIGMYEFGHRFKYSMMMWVFFFFNIIK